MVDLVDLVDLVDILFLMSSKLQSVHFMNRQQQTQVRLNVNVTFDRANAGKKPPIKAESPTSSFATSDVEPAVEPPLNTQAVSAMLRTLRIAQMCKSHQVYSLLTCLLESF